MPCTQGDSISNEEIELFLSVLEPRSMTDSELSFKLNLPLFKVRSKIRELKKLGYIDENDGEYVKK
ncbi:hypothetical protein [Radiobacillus sp. PE A8.2]|uniref:hypothetical protein n=1 Tax=Radiobacillus sp. PE A8.2 TaxID=3380349 RepID=UPI00388EA2E8